MTQAEVGLIIVALSVTSYFLRRLPTVRSVGVFTGILMIGFSGTVIHAAAGLMKFVTGLLGLTVGKALGVTAGSVVAAIVAVLLFVMIHDWLPKNPGKGRTFWISAAVAIMITAAATPWAALNQLPATVQQGITTTQG